MDGIINVYKEKGYTSHDSKTSRYSAPEKDWTHGNAGSGCDRGTAGLSGEGDQSV